MRSVGCTYRDSCRWPEGFRYGRMMGVRTGWRSLTVRRRILLAILAFALVAAAVIVPLTLPSGPAPKVGEGALRAPRAGTPICGQPVLDSPWNYDGAPGTYTTSGTPAGLPTFGAVGTDFPRATSVLVVAAGDNTSAAGAGAYKVNNTVIYFEPGTHTIQGVMWTGDNSAYVGGYTTSAGRAVLDGAGSDEYLSSSSVGAGRQGERHVGIPHYQKLRLQYQRLGDGGRERR